MSPESYDLQRFLEAQRRVYPQVLRELRQGQKQSHWMWYIFPQIQGLGRSAMARKYAVYSLAEAREYLEHPVLGPRLLECTRLITEIEGRSIAEILGYPDDLKFQSSMTLFAHAARDEDALEEAPFLRALDKYFNGKMDRQTSDRLRKEMSSA